MSKVATLANQILPATVVLSVITFGIGLFACPLRSQDLMYAFNVLSAITAFGVIASVVWHFQRRTQYERGFKAQYGLLPWVLFWVLLLLAWQSDRGIRESSARGQMINNGKQIGLGAHGYDEVNKRLPSNLIDAKGTPMLSWRVDLLPYMEHAPMHEQFKLSQPWDSPANAPFIDKMPAIYANVWGNPEPGKTHWQAFVGPGTAFEPGARLRLASDFPDGTSYTILCVFAQDSVTWTKPEDIPYGPNVPLPPLGQPWSQKGVWPFCCYVDGPPRFLACMADGTVQTINADLPELRLRRLIVRNDGEGNDGLLD